jgi:hypothetical protein
MRYIIACSGSGSRWNNYLGRPKHLIEIDNETLISRTVRLIKKYDKNNEIIIMAYRKDYKVNGTCLHVPNLFTQSKHVKYPAIYTCHNIWNRNGKTILLFGDIFFTENAIKKIINKSYYNTFKILFFGRKGSSELTNKKYGEIFGMSFNFIKNKIILKNLEELKIKYEKKEIDRFITWELYKKLNNINLNDIKFKFNSNFIDINDFTEDFDYPCDFINWIEKYNKYKRNSD